MINGSVQNLSVMVFDICQFTTLSRKIGAEKAFKLLNTIFEITDSIIINKYNGMIDKKMGDAAIALFGLGDSTGESHALNATAAALSIQEAMFDDFGRLQEAAGGQLMVGGPIQLRIGVSSGDVYLGNVGSKEHINFTAIGEVVNSAQRIEMNCPPGRVLVSEAVANSLNNTDESIHTEYRKIEGKHAGEEYAAYLVKRDNTGTN